MKKILFALFLIGLAWTSSLTAKAEEKTINGDKLTLTAGKRTALADGKDFITFTAILPTLEGGSPCGDFTGTLAFRPDFGLDALVTGSENIIEGLSPSKNICSNNPNTCHETLYLLKGKFNCSAKTVSFNLSSTKEEVKTVSVFIANSGYPFDPVSISVTFNKPSVASSSTPKVTTMPKTTPTPTPTVAKPAPPTLSTLNNIALPETKLSDQTIREGSKVVLSGKTTPNSKVKLYIYSDPTTVETTSDKDGNWTYAIENLEKGDHRVEAEVTDEKGATSDKVELAKFTVSEKLIPIEPIKTEPYKFQLRHLFDPINYILVGVLIILIAGLIFIEVKRRKQLRAVV